jgi:hypothetical protein
MDRPCGLHGDALHRRFIRQRAYWHGKRECDVRSHRRSAMPKTSSRHDSAHEAAARASQRMHLQTGMRKPDAPRPPVTSIDPADPVEQASYDSFPASDPPAYSARRSTPGGRPKPTAER